MIPVERFDATTRSIAALVATLRRLDEQRRQHCAALADTVHRIGRMHDAGVSAELECVRLITLHRELDALERRAITAIAGFSAFLEAMHDD